MRVEVVEKYSIDRVNKNPDKIFVFGDNLLRMGKGGQARIRDLPNTFGIATKRIPRMTFDSYLRDGLPLHESAVRNDIEHLYKLSLFTDKTIVFPYHGIGTGLAKMRTECPNLFNMLGEELEKKFGFINDPEKRNNGQCLINQ